MIKPQPAGSSGVRTAAILLAVIAMLYLAREILIPLAFALTLALILTPAVVWLQKMRVGRVWEWTCADMGNELSRAAGIPFPDTSASAPVNKPLRTEMKS